MKELTIGRRRWSKSSEFARQNRWITSMRTCQPTATMAWNHFWSRILVCLFSTVVKVIYPKYSKHWPYTVAHTIDCVCSKMLNHGLNHGLFLLLFKLIHCHIHWILYVLAYSYLNFKAVLALPKTADSAQTLKNISFIWIVWSTLYVYLCYNAELIATIHSITEFLPRDTKFWSTKALSCCCC